MPRLLTIASAFNRPSLASATPSRCLTRDQMSCRCRAEGPRRLDRLEDRDVQQHVDSDLRFRLPKATARAPPMCEAGAPSRRVGDSINSERNHERPQQHLCAGHSPSAKRQCGCEIAIYRVLGNEASKRRCQHRDGRQYASSRRPYSPSHRCRQSGDCAGCACGNPDDEEQGPLRNHWHTLKRFMPIYATRFRNWLPAWVWYAKSSVRASRPRFPTSKIPAIETGGRPGCSVVRVGDDPDCSTCTGKGSRVRKLTA